MCSAIGPSLVYTLKQRAKCFDAEADLFLGCFCLEESSCSIGLVLEICSSLKVPVNLVLRLGACWDKTSLVANEAQNAVGSLLENLFRRRGVEDDG